MVKVFTMIAWIGLNVLLLSQLVGLYFEIVNGNYSWWYFWSGAALICLVNITIILDQAGKK